MRKITLANLWDDLGIQLDVTLSLPFESIRCSFAEGVHRWTKFNFSPLIALEIGEPDCESPSKIREQRDIRVRRLADPGSGRKRQPNSGVFADASRPRKSR